MEIEFTTKGLGLAIFTVLLIVFFGGFGLGYLVFK